MNVKSTRLNSASIAPAQAPTLKDGESQSFGLEFDPFSGVKETFREGASNVGEFLYGATPGFGTKAHLQNSFWGSDTTASTIGAGINLAGTISGVVGLGQLAFGADPTIAFGIAAGSMATSGTIYSVIEG